MRVLICGSRDTGNSEAARSLIFETLSVLPRDTIIVHGDARRGVDSWADAIAFELDLEREPHPAEWDRYGKQAGLIRNVEMLDSGVTFVIAFWNGFSRGTLHTITEARARGIETRVIPLEPL